tara:strand:- start:392 stop:664 length:273 start_codon:yes stop_codon:yes gene_type:complete
MYEKQIEFPFMKREKDYEVTINYKGFSYRGYKRLQFDEESGLYRFVYVHTLVGPNKEEVSYIKRGRQDQYESAIDFQEYIDDLIEVAPPL